MAELNCKFLTDCCRNLKHNLYNQDVQNQYNVYLAFPPAYILR